MIPTGPILASPWLWVAALLAAGGIFSSGVWVGKEFAEGQEAKERIVEVEKKVEVVKKVTVGQEQIARKFEEGRASREKEIRGLREELEQAIEDRTVVVVGQCSLTDDVVRLLNAARGHGRSAPDTSKPSPAVPSAPTPGERSADNRGQAPADGRGVLRGMPGEARSADFHPEVPREAVQLTQGVAP